MSINLSKEKTLEIIELLDAFKAFLIDSLDVDEVTPQPIAKQYYTLKELSSISSISVRSLRERVKRGSLTACTTVKPFLVHTDEVQRFLHQLEYKKRPKAMRA